MMGLARWDLLEALARRLGAMRYLEVGVQNGDCFGKVRVAEKVGVDPVKGTAATINLTSDAYFAQLPKEERFDLVFVDGLHHRDQVHRDILNAWEHLTPGGAIVVHDCDPPNEAAGSRAQCGGIWCGDVWRGWMDARRSLAGRAYLGVVATDLGCGLVLPLGEGRVEVPPPWSVEETDRATWDFFAHRRAQWLNTIHPDAFHALVATLAPLREE
jgi:hypothetical protein